jgi:TPR repeat protein
MIFLWIYQKKRPLARAWLGSALLSALTLMSPLVFADYDKAVEYYDSGQLQEAFAEWQADAYAGNSIAQRKLGLMYLHGESVPQDTTKGVFWLTRAAEQKDSYAALVLSAINDKDNKDNKDNKDDKGRNLGLSSYALSLAYDSGPDMILLVFRLQGVMPQVIIFAIS